MQWLLELEQEEQLQVLQEKLNKKALKLLSLVLIQLEVFWLSQDNLMYQEDLIRLKV